ncbi:HopJ type III effector protein [Marinobacter zhejiangensis]|uniref:HopJ type III effector protein n=1 Tax=Marinobacter zhejiangensis TaxID=488535 RepID=A0A1I4N744_9GAMM|nr:HopJ type III effector protein [Marinobacter zhejiangensis]SFM11382.1 HopJ type III effector protein [Marinobacter zhejiangensis]
MNVTDAIRIHLAALEAGRSDFEDSMELVERYFDHTPTSFANGPLLNSAEENQGSCKLFALGQFCNLTEAETLSCFGRHYRQVLGDPAGTSHGNIRQFMATGWSGIRFDGEPLRLGSTPESADSQDASRP